MILHLYINSCLDDFSILTLNLDLICAHDRLLDVYYIVDGYVREKEFTPQRRKEAFKSKFCYRKEDLFEFSGVCDRIREFVSGFISKLIL